MQNSPSLEIDFSYDDEQHYAPPIRIKWVTRSINATSYERWIFIQCCGQIGQKEEGLITSRHPCKGQPDRGRFVSQTIEVTKKHHPGQLILKRITHSQVVKHKPPLAVWKCCGAKIPPWSEAWQSRYGKIPFELVDSGCKEGKYVNTGPFGSSVGDSGATSNRDVALRAKPIAQRPKAPKKSAKKSSGPSSGEETVIIKNRKLMNPTDIKFTQKTVLKTFSDPSKPSVLELMQLIFDGAVNVEELPKIRVATPLNKEQPGNSFFSCDNRRLFLFKALLLKEIEVQWIEWTSEFDSKLDQNIRMDPETRMEASDEGLNAFRKDFIKYCFENRERRRADIKTATR